MIEVAKTGAYVKPEDTVVCNTGELKTVLRVEGSKHSKEGYVIYYSEKGSFSEERHTLRYDEAVMVRELCTPAATAQAPTNA